MYETATRLLIGGVIPIRRFWMRVWEGIEGWPGGEEGFTCAVPVFDIDSSRRVGSLARRAVPSQKRCVERNLTSVVQQARWSRLFPG